MQELNQAARMAESAYMAKELYIDQQLAVIHEVEKCKDCAAPVMCWRHAQYFCAMPYCPSTVEPAVEEPGDYDLVVSFLGEDCMFAGESKSLCQILRVHTDPW